jgi:hypothetical protein
MELDVQTHAWLEHLKRKRKKFPCNSLRVASIGGISKHKILLGKYFKVKKFI